MVDPEDVDWTGGMETPQGIEELRESQEVAEVENIKTYKFLWFVFFGVIFIAILLAVFFLFNGNNKRISQNSLIEGISVEVGESEAVKFKLDEEEHGMKINFVGEDFVDITISSEPLNLSLKINEVRELDLDNDGIADLRVKLVKIENGKATVAIMKIEKEICEENWECSEWRSCFAGKQTRNCDDLNDCGTYFDRPELKKDCLEIEFIENKSAFNNTTNKSLNNTNNLTGCYANTFACYESEGYFCSNLQSTSKFNPICCSKQCVRFSSPEQFCYTKGYLKFMDNQTHMCKDRIFISFNGTNVSCCESFVSRTNAPFVEGLCAGQGENFYINLLGDPSNYPERCLSGLKNVSSVNNISVADKCYEVGTETNSPEGVCSYCGNGICEEVESVCGCFVDCVGKEKSDYKTIEEFCNSDYGKTILNHCTEPLTVDMPFCALCANYL